MITASAPGRFGLVGNPSDMYGGTVISCSTAERATCRIHGADSDFSIMLGGQREYLKSRDDLRLTGSAVDLIKAALTALSIDPSVCAPISIEAESDIPRQSGLAGSTALLASIFGALLEHFGQTTHRYAVAEKVRATEFDLMKTLCGFQDAYMTVFGGLRYMDFRGKSVALNNEYQSGYASLEPLHEVVPHIPCVIAFTGVMHHSGRTHTSLYERFGAGDPEAVSAASEFASYAHRAKRPMIDGDWAVVADLMNRNQSLIRQVQPQNPANEKLIEAALGAGALAAKLAGAGGGGSIVALTHDPESISKALLEAGAAAILTPGAFPGLTVSLD